jgi:hypothetical protein
VNWIRWAGLLALVSVASCAYGGGDITNPLTRKFQWFSFLAGDDMRAACVPGAPDRFRLVYNGIWKEQVRIYELGASAPHRLDEHVIGPGNLFILSTSDPLAPWRGTNASVALTDEQYAGLTRALAASGAYDSPQDTLTLASTDFYWVAASCHAGAFHLTGWRYPSPGFAHLEFPQILGGLDQTGVSFNPPRPWTEVATAPLGSSDNPARGAANATTWTIGISRDQLIDHIVF